MENSKQAIIFIPGLQKMEKGESLDLLVKGMLEFQEEGECKLRSQIDVSGFNGVELDFILSDRKEKKIELFEAYWGDLIGSLDQVEPVKKIFKSSELLIYWLFSPIWKSFFSSKFLVLNIVGGALLLMAWYLGILTIGLIAIAESQNFLGISLSENASQNLKCIAEYFGGTKLWLGSSIIMSFFPVNSLVRIAEITKIYFQSLSLKSKIRNRVKELFQNCLENKQYHSISLVSHSFGCIVLTDLIADDTLVVNEKNIKVITLGSPISFLIHRSKWLCSRFEKFKENHLINNWVNFYSESDWFGSKLDDIKNERFLQINMPDEASFFDKMMGKPHNIYFESYQVFREIIND